MSADTSSAIAVRAEPRGIGFDPWFRALCASAAILVLAMLSGIIVSLIIGGWPALKAFGFGFITSTEWNPVTDVYGAAGPIAGTLITAFGAIVIALPIAICVSVFLVEFCPVPFRRTIGTAVELLAGIPSIVYGMWGLFVFAPWLAEHVQLPLIMTLDPESFLAKLMYGIPNGTGILSASIILAIMILPFMSATFQELLLTVPPQLRESAYGLGATPLEVISRVSFPYIKRGVVGAVMLGLGRALGETMAVTFIIGNAHNFPQGLFDSGSTIASTIANEFAEATPGLHEASLISLGLILFVITFAVLGVARWFLSKTND